MVFSPQNILALMNYFPNGPYGSVEAKNHESHESYWSISSICLGLASMTFSLIIPLMYYYHPKTRQHPSILLVILCLAECSEIYHQIFGICFFTTHGSNVYLKDFVYKKQLKFVLGYYPFNLDQINLNFPFWLNSFYLCFFWTIQQLLYIAWCADLILTLKQPFLSPTFRLKIYIPSVFSLSFSQTILLNYFAYFDEKKTCMALILIPWGKISFKKFSFIISCIFFHHILLSCNNQSNKITKIYIHQGNKIKLFNTVSGFFGFDQFNMDVYTSNYNQLFKGFGDRLVSKLSIQFTLGSILQSRFLFTNNLFVGIIIGLLRVREKYFRQQLFNSIFQFMGMRKDDLLTQNELTNDLYNVPLSLLLRNTQSQEVMSGILEGIKESVKNYGQINHDYQDLKRTSSRFIESRQRSEVESLIRFSSVQCEDQQESFIVEDQVVQFRILEYAPEVFAYLRGIDKIGLSEIQDSLSISKNKIAIEQLSESMGKSGSIFFKSYDQRFIIKTITKDELDFLIKILPKYRSYIRRNNRSLLARLYGCFAVQSDNVSPVYLILMENTLQKLNEPYKTFDLKGSLIGRNTNNSYYGKDQDFLKQDSIFLTLQQKTTIILQNQIIKDSKFLMDLNIMDYSLLLGVRTVEDLSSNQKNHYDKTIRFVTDQLHDRQYSFGIIDYLQQYDHNKQFENKYKSLFDKEILISSIQPKLYSVRFINFLNSIVCSCSYLVPLNDMGRLQTLVEQTIY